MPEPSHRGDPARKARAEFEATGVESAAHARPGGECPGDLIDRYRLIEPIGEGGMGTVWEAQQSDPVRRRVALKIIKLGMDTREVVVRFEVERQALGRLVQLSGGWRSIKREESRPM